MLQSVHVQCAPTSSILNALAASFGGRVSIHRRVCAVVLLLVDRTRERERRGRGGYALRDSDVSDRREIHRVDMIVVVWADL